MTLLNYPEGQDLLWIALDADGRLAAFLTGGEAPIPEILLTGNIDIYSVEDEISQLPVVTSHRLLISVPRPDDFISLAERGLFVYDWRDLHRGYSRASHRYEMVSAPATPLSVANLKVELRDLAGLVCLKDIRFEQCEALDVASYVDCCTGEL